jgi:hypothetical protein
LGNDPRAVLRALKVATPKEKSEFETTEDYQKRVARSADVPLFGTLRTSSTFAFVLPSSESPAYDDKMYPNLETQYDADTETMIVKVGFDSIETDTHHFSKDRRSIVWNESGTGREAYIGTNAFGATRAVKKLTILTTALAIGIDSPFYPGGDELLPGKLYLSFKVPPNKARLQEKRLRVLIVAGLLRPYSFEEEIYREPTFDDPNESDETYRYLSVDIKDVWLIDIATGNVIAKAAPEDH